MPKLWGASNSLTLGAMNNANGIKKATATLVITSPWPEVVEEKIQSKRKREETC